METFDPFAEFGMSDHSAIVTGGAKNIGAAIARSLAGAGAKVMIADLNGQKAQKTAGEIAEQTGGEVLGIGCDVTKQEHIDACVAYTVEWMLGLAHYFAKKVRINTVLIGTVITPSYAEAGLDQKTQDALAHPNVRLGTSRVWGLEGPQAMDEAEYPIHRNVDGDTWAYDGRGVYV